MTHRLGSMLALGLGLALGAFAQTWTTPQTAPITTEIGTGTTTKLVSWQPSQISYDFQWQASGSRVPGLTEFRATIANDGPEEAKVYGLDVLKAASSPPPGARWRSIPWVANVGVKRAVDQANKHGFWYYAGVTCEVGGYLGSIAVAGRLAEIRERAAVFFPLGAGLCSAGRMIRSRERPKLVVPADLLPGIFYVAPGGRVDFSVFATE